jgi:hypothetical protein
VGTADHVADLVGDEWAKREREACVAFVTGFREDTASVGVRLLSDLRDVFDADKVPSTELILTTASTSHGGTTGTASHSTLVVWRSSSSSTESSRRWSASARRPRVDTTVKTFTMRGRATFCP